MSSHWTDLCTAPEHLRQRVRSKARGVVCEDGWTPLVTGEGYGLVETEAKTDLPGLRAGVYGATSVFAIDLDGDGDIDVLSASSSDDKIAWYENDGSEGFTKHEISTAASGAYSVFAIDLDGDGDIDVLSASISDDKIAWYENDGNEGFTEHSISTAASGASSVFAIDLDGDGDIDVL
ncbi:hypothetical protein B484DRAFT_410638, partial [Ochromonadaceae sp. CCMP2298]